MIAYCEGKSYDLDNEEDEAEYNKKRKERQNRANAQAFLIGLIDKAAKGEHTKFEYLRNMDSALGAAAVLKALRKMLKSLKINRNKFFRKYKKTGDYTFLVAYRQLKDTYEFYTIEIKILRSMCLEFLSYAFRHLRFLADGNERPESECVDWRDPKNRK